MFNQKQTKGRRRRKNSSKDCQLGAWGTKVTILRCKSLQKRKKWSGFFVKVHSLAIMYLHSAVVYVKVLKKTFTATFSPDCHVTEDREHLQEQVRASLLRGTPWISCSACCTCVVTGMHSVQNGEAGVKTKKRTHVQQKLLTFNSSKCLKKNNNEGMTQT